MKRDPLSRLVDLTCDGFFFAGEDVRVSATNLPGFVDGKLHEHVGISLFFLAQSPDSKRRPPLVRRGWRRRVLRIGQINRLLLVLGSRSFRLAIQIDGVIRIYDVDVIVISSGLGPAPGQKCRHRGPTAGSPPPPGIPEATDIGSGQGSRPPPATSPPSVIEEIIMVIAHTVPYLHSAAVPERRHSI